MLNCIIKIINNAREIFMDLAIFPFFFFGCKPEIIEEEENENEEMGKD